MKYHFITYGCQMNTADSEEMARPLQARGFFSTDDLGDADIALMNTCTVREHAEHKALSNLGRLRTWKAENPNRILIVAGCAATLWGESVKKKYPYVDLVSPATQIDQFPDAVARILHERWNFVDEWQEGQPIKTGDEVTEWRADAKPQEARDAAPPSWFGTDATAYVTIMRGCNLNCSYCIVPQVRGREQYRPMPEILREVTQKIRAGQRDVMLLGQTVNSYYWRDGQSRVYDFSDLLREIDGIFGIKSIRFLSPHPAHMRESVIRAMKESASVAHHLHLPVQSGSDTVLERMKRLYTRSSYLATVQALRTAIPDIAITTDVIIGYPGETADDFEQTLSLLEEVRFHGLFAFKYSPRPNTPSASLPDDVSEEEKEARLQRTLALNVSLNENRAAV